MCGAQLEARGGVKSRRGPGKAAASGLGVKTWAGGRGPQRRAVGAHPFAKAFHDFVIIVFMHSSDSIRTASRARFHTFVCLALRFEHHESTSKLHKICRFSQFFLHDNTARFNIGSVALLREGYTHDISMAVE